MSRGHQFSKKFFGKEFFVDILCVNVQYFNNDLWRLEATIVANDKRRCRMRCENDKSYCLKVGEYSSDSCYKHLNSKGKTRTTAQKLFGQMCIKEDCTEPFCIKSPNWDTYFLPTLICATDSWTY